MTLSYNLVMLALDVAAIELLRRRGGLVAWGGVVACAGAAALVLAALLGGISEDHFGVIRLCSYGFFLHGPALLAATAFLWRRQLPWLAGLASAAVVAIGLIAAEAFLIEPQWLEVSRLVIASPQIRRPLRIVVVADLQTDRIGPYERGVLRLAMAEKPDLILFAGDYLQAPRQEQPKLRDDLRQTLRDVPLSALRGVFAVQGNVEPGGWQAAFDGLPITAVAETRSFDLGDVQLTCLSLADSFNPGLRVSGSQPDRFHIVLGHVPNFARGVIAADLLLAGHTHGGQVRLPGVGPMITHASVPHRWAAGLTELPGGGKLLVSRGVGMERGYAPPMRFLCRPELVVIDLTPESKGAADAHR